ncbi:MAG: agmatine deiminase family protein [Hyphomonadaceae bacterium]|nr:agmatine deiminase family protein [Hyphomonadaceae bacterium]
MTDIHVPPEWAPHAAIWTAWPWNAAEWGGDVAPARADIAAMIAALHAGGRGERLKVLAATPEALNNATAALGAMAEVIALPYGDIWLRDTGPIFARRGGERLALRFAFNGWGGKYVMDGDERVAAAIAARTGAALIAHAFVLEGGAVDLDGDGALITTRQCVLNPNRNPGWTEARAEAALKAAFGVRRIIWLDEGLANDHTDGHVDNIARFVAPGRVVCQAPHGDDPNAAALVAIARTLETATDAHGRKLDVIRIPSPGRVVDEDGAALPASHMNFIIGDAAVVVPVYSDSGDDAVRALAPLFPDRKTIGVSAHGLLRGGGSFHCITQQEPA